MVPRDPFRPGIWAGWAIVLVLLILVPVACQVSQAQPAQQVLRFSPAACKQLAELAQMAGQARDRGIAEPALMEVLDYFLGAYRMPEPIAAVVRTEVRRVYGSARTPDQDGEALFTRCVTGPLGAPEA